MKSNKQRYNDSMQSRKGSTGNNNGNGPMWFIIFIVIFALLISLYQIWNEGVLGKGDLSIGIGKLPPEIERIK